MFKILMASLETDIFWDTRILPCLANLKMCPIDILSIFSLERNEIVIWQFFLRVEKTFRELATFKYLPLPVAYRAIAVRRAR